MLRFDKTQRVELKDFLYQSCIHDAVLKGFQYDRKQKVLSMEVVNSIHDVRMNLTFLDVEIIFSISGYELGDRDTILSATLEEDYSNIKHDRTLREDVLNDCLYLLFQMFSGDELHIVSNTLLINLS